LQIDMHLNPTPAFAIFFFESLRSSNKISGMPVLQKATCSTRWNFVQSEGMHPVAPRRVNEMTGVPPGRYNVEEKKTRNSGQFEQSSDVDLVRNGPRS